jgi:endo-1,4-beta-xylanase
LNIKARHSISARRNLHVLVSLLATGISFAQSASPTLRSVYQDDFLIGAALNTSQVNGENPSASEIAARQFSSVTAENDMKWIRIHPEPGCYDFKKADAYVEFARSNKMALIGHTLVWHSQIPDWVFKGKDGGDATRAELLARMKDHIDTVAGRYKGKVRGWDVVNEAISDGPEGLRDSPWRRIIGDDFIDHAFRFAKAADPQAELYYNDYALENPEKRARTMVMLKGLIQRGVPIDAVGMQCHLGLESPEIVELNEAIRDFAALGLKVMITELDVDVLPSRGEIGVADISRVEESDPKLDPYTSGLPDEVQRQLAERYAGLFRVFLQHGKDIIRVTFWGLDDGHTWLNNFPICGRTNHPLLINREMLPKPAFFAVLQAHKRKIENH